MIYIDILQLNHLYPSYSGLQLNRAKKRISTENFAIKIFSVDGYILKNSGVNLSFCSIIIYYVRLYFKD